MSQEWQDGHFLERADSGAIAAVHDAALVHILVSHCSALLSCVYAWQGAVGGLTGCLQHGSHVCQDTFPILISCLFFESRSWWTDGKLPL